MGQDALVAAQVCIHTLLLSINTHVGSYRLREQQPKRVRQRLLGHRSGPCLPINTQKKIWVQVSAGGIRQWLAFLSWVLSLQLFMIRLTSVRLYRRHGHSGALHACCNRGQFIYPVLSIMPE